MPENVGCVLDAADVSADTVEGLASRLGLNALFVRGALAASAVKGKVPVPLSGGRAPGLDLGDDTALRAAIDAARSAGVDPYLVFSNPLVGSPGWTDLLAKDKSGRPATELDAESPVLCPNHPKLLKWLAAAAEALVKTYRPVGVLLSGFGLGAPERVDTLFLCWCDVCQARMGELGYDSDRVRIGMQGVRTKLLESRPGSAVPTDCGLGQYLEALGYDTGILDWLNFRADSVSACLYEVRQALTGADAGLRVGILSKAPTVGFLAGQRRADLLRDQTIADFHAPVICGTGSGVLSTIAAHAEVIRTTRPATDEADALALAAILHGYHSLPLPGAAEELVRDPGPERLLLSAARELKLAMGGGPAVQRWPAIDVAGLPQDVVAQAAGRIDEAGAAGLVYVGMPQ